MRNPDAYRLYLIFAGATSFLFAVAYTVAAVYRVTEAGLDPLQLVLVGTALEATYFLFNVPTGVVADTYSRRLSVIAGVVLWGFGLTLEGSMPVFSAILLAQVLGGIGYTLVEGALEAWLADEVGEQRVGAALLHGGQVERAAGFVGIGASVALASLALGLPLLVSGVAFLALAAYLVAAMRESRFRRPTRAAADGWRERTRRAAQELQTTGRDAAVVARRRPLALTILAVAALFGGFSEGFDRLWEAHLLTTVGLPDLGALEPVVWFGIIRAGGQLLGIGAAGGLQRWGDLERTAGTLRALVWLEGVLLAGVLAFALARSLAVAVAAFWLASVARSLVGPVYTAWINRGVEPRVRATVLSMSGQADALGQFTVGPGLGGLGSAFGLRVALSAAGLVLVPAVWLYGRALRRSGRDREDGNDPTPTTESTAT